MPDLQNVHPFGRHSHSSLCPNICVWYKLIYAVNIEEDFLSQFICNMLVNWFNNEFICSIFQLAEDKVTHWRFELSDMSGQCIENSRLITVGVWIYYEISSFDIVLFIISTTMRFTIIWQIIGLYTGPTPNEDLIRLSMRYYCRGSHGVWPL